MPFLPITAELVTAVAGVASFKTDAATVTTQSLATAVTATATFTIANPQVDPTSQVMASVANGTNSAGAPIITSVTPGNAVVTIVILNGAAAGSFNGTLKISIIVFN